MSPCILSTSCSKPCRASSWVHSFTICLYYNIAVAVVCSVHGSSIRGANITVTSHLWLSETLPALWSLMLLNQKYTFWCFSTDWCVFPSGRTWWPQTAPPFKGYTFFSDVTCPRDDPESVIKDRIENKWLAWHRTCLATAKIQGSDEKGNSSEWLLQLWYKYVLYRYVSYTVWLKRLCGASVA